MAYPVSANVVFTPRHAEWSVSWTRNTPKCETKTSQSEDVHNKLSFLHKLIPTTKDLQIVLYIYQLLSNYACRTGRVGDIPLIEFTTAQRAVRQTNALKDYKEILEVWIQRILNHEWLNDETVMSVLDSKYVPKPNEISKELK